MKFSLVTKYNEFLQLEDEWNRLVNNLESTQIFYSWNWIKTYLDKIDYKLRNSLCIVVGREKNDIGIIVPFLKEGEIIRFITNKTVDYNNILVSKAENKYNAISKAITFLLKEVTFLEFNLTNFKGETELFIFQDVINNNKSLKIIMQDSVMVPVLKISNKDIKMKKKAIKDIQRREKRLIEIGNVSINIGVQPNQLVWNKLKEFHKQRWKKSVFRNDKYIEFYETFIQEKSSNIEFSYIQLDEKILAIHFGFKDRDKIYYYIPAYDEEYVTYGVGGILLYNIIEVYSNEIREFDFLRGNEQYKFNWTDEINMNFEVKVFKNNFRGKNNYLINLIKLTLKKSRTLRKLLNKN